MVCSSTKITEFLSIIPTIDQILANRKHHLNTFPCCHQVTARTDNLPNEPAAAKHGPVATDTLEKLVIRALLSYLNIEDTLVNPI